MAQEPEKIVGPGPSSPVMRPATPNAFRKSVENRLPRNINFLWPLLAIAAAAGGWATFGDDLMRLADSKSKDDGKADRHYAAPPTGGFDLTFPPELKVAEAPPPLPPPPPPPPEPAPPSSFAEQKPEPEIDTTPPPEPDGGMIDRSFQDQPQNPFGPVSKKVSMLGQDMKDDFGIDAVTRDKWQGCAIEPGYVVPVNLVHHVNSEIPGPAVFETREPYYSPANPHEPLLPVGTRFIGHYRSEDGGGAGDKLGDTRLSFKITTAAIPNGRTMRRLKLNDARIAVLSGNGMVGLGGEVDQKLLPLLGYATIAALIDSATRTTTEEDSLGGRVRGSAADNYGDVGREVAERTIDVAPKIEIRPGPAQLLFSDPVRVAECR